MNRPGLGRAPDYTAAALISGGVNLFCLLVVIWASLGFPVVLLVALVLNHLIDRLARHRRRIEASRAR